MGHRRTNYLSVLTYELVNQISDLSSRGSNHKSRFPTSSPSIVNHRIKTFQFDTSIDSRKPPIDLNKIRIALVDPSLNFLVQSLFIGYTAVDALSGQDTQFDFSHV